MLALRSLLVLILVVAGGVHSQLLDTIYCGGLPVNNTLINIGGLFPLTGSISTGPARAAATQLAVEKVNNDTSILPGFTLQLITLDSGTSSQIVSASALDLVLHANFTSSSVVGVVGAASSSVSETAQLILQNFNRPQISYSSTSATLSDKSLFPYFKRVVPSDALQGQGLAQIVANFDFPEVCIIASSDTYGAQGAALFTAESEKIGVDIILEFIVNSFSQEEVDEDLNQIKESGVRVIFIMMTDGNANFVFERALALGLLAPEYVWVGSDAVMQSGVYTRDGEENIELRDNLLGLIGTQPSGGRGELFEEFLDIWEDAYEPGEFIGAGDRNINFFAPFAYDAFYAYAHALDEMYTDDPLNFMDRIYSDEFGAALLDQLNKTDFIGLTGRVQFDDNGDRGNPTYDIVNLQQGGTFALAGTWAPASGVSVADDAIIWPDGTTTPPDIQPVRDSSADIIWVEWDDPVAITLLILYGLTAIICVVFLIIVLLDFFLLKSGVVQDTGIIFNIIILVGVFLSSLVIYLYTGEPNDGVCGARVWLLLIFAFLYGNLLAKEISIVIQYFTMKGKSTVHPNYGKVNKRGLIELGAANAVLIAIQLVIIIFWSAIDIPEPNVIDTAGDDDQRVCESSTEIAWYVLQFTFVLILFVPAIPASILGIRVPSMRSQSKFVGVVLFLVTCILVVTIIATILLQDVGPTAMYSMFGFGLWLSQLVILALFVVTTFAVIKEKVTKAPEIEMNRDLAGESAGDVDLDGGDDGLEDL